MLTSELRNQILHKRYAGIFILVILIQSVSAQTISNYSFSAFSNSYVEITGGISPTAFNFGGLDDGSINNLPIGFDFWYMGNHYNTFHMSTNGWIGFVPITNDQLNNDLEGTINELKIAPLWDDIELITSSNFQYQTSGTEPNRILTIEYKNMLWDHNTGIPSISFQVKLYETSGVIDFYYRHETSTPGGALGGSIGISASGSGPGTFISLQDVSASPVVSTSTEVDDIINRPANNQVYRFTPPVPIAPGNLTFSNVSCSSMTLAWQDFAPDELGYAVYLSIDGGISYSHVATMPANSTSYTSSGLTSNKIYFWKVYAFSEGALSGVTGSQSTSCFSSQPASASVCLGETTSFTANAACAGSTFQWQLSTDGGSNWNNLLDTAFYTGSGTATLALSSTTIAMNNHQYHCILNGDCGASTAATLTVTAAQSPLVSNVSRCGEGTLMIAATSTEPNVEWYDQPTNGSLLFTGTTYTTPILSADATYYVSASNANGCKSTPRVSVQAIIEAESVGGNITLELNPGEISILHLENFTGTILQWESSLDNFSTSTSISHSGTSLEHDSEQDTYYRVLVQSGNCTAAYSDTLFVKGFHIYNHFSPNGDALNDTWIIDGIDGVKNVEVKIFDRQGNLVFEEKQYDNLEKVWRGEYNTGANKDKLLPEGTYFFKIEQRENVRSGFVVIKN